MEKEKEKRNSINFVKTTIEGLKVTPNQNVGLLTLSTFFGLGGINQWVITVDGKGAALSFLISALSGSTTLVLGYVEGRTRLSEQRRTGG